jgi:hypothetical protein
VSSNYLVPCGPSTSKKNHKIELTFNKSTNWMSHTGTAFSAANWETDTKAYMETVTELPERRIKEIVAWATPFMKRVRRNITSIDISKSGSSTPPPVNPRSHIHICIFLCFFPCSCITDPLLAEFVVVLSCCHFVPLQSLPSTPHRKSIIFAPAAA